MTYVIGIDEVGRGPIAGPLVVCACAVRHDVDILSLFPKGVLKDSKKLSEKVRIEIANKVDGLVEEGSIIYGLGEMTAHQIDTLGLSVAIKTAMQKSLDVLHAHDISKETKVYLDGSLYAPTEYSNQETIIKGDEKIGQIALASIIAKVYRDTKMRELAKEFPHYGFDSHVGYGTKAHYDAIKSYGVTDHHRKSFLKTFLKN